jgi:RecA/RadA recombinase
MHARKKDKNVIAGTVLAVLPSLAGKLAENFLEHKRKKVDIAELQDQIASLVAANHQMRLEAQDTRLAVMSLTRYLATSQSNVFVFQNNQLELSATLRENDQRQSIGKAISEFDSAVRASARQRLAQEAQVASGEQAKVQVRQGRAAPENIASDPLDDFFDDFDREIMNRRLGREG